MKNIWLFGVLLCLMKTLSAQDTFIIKDVALFDGDSIMPKTSVYVENGTIAKIAPEIHIATEKIIDGQGKTLIPALSNAHVHAWSPASLQEAAKAGVLNVMDMHGVEPFQMGMRKLKDSVNYANYYVAGYAATAPEGHGTQFGFPVPTLQHPNEAKDFIQERIKAQVDYIKIIVEPYKNTLSKETVAGLIEAAHEFRKITVVHVSHLSDAVEVISNSADGLAHIWRDKAIDTTTLNNLASSYDFFVIPTLLTTIKAHEQMGSDANDYLSKSELLAELKKLHQAKIPILAGTDPPNLGINYGDDLYKELLLFKDSGMSTEAVLKTATSQIAQAFKLKDLGYIKEGIKANMILFSGDLVQDLNVLYNDKIIWKNGKRINL